MVCNTQHSLEVPDIGFMLAKRLSSFKSSRISKITIQIAAHYVVSVSNTASTRQMLVSMLAVIRFRSLDGLAFLRYRRTQLFLVLIIIYR
jgi:hypothetical protein